MKKTIFSLLATLAVLGTTAASSGRPEVAHLVLTVASVDGSWSDEVVLSCPGEPGVGHPHREAACADLQAVGGVLDVLYALPADSGTCLSSNDPVVATAKGTYRGIPVDWTRSYENGCMMRADTASLFVF
ncbi:MULTISPECIES: SSI family serine proteinase inhibitor [Streptomyces]|uniref:SSI family serine proteinase inhibitor n=1 Tax=Streptomyces solicathayae TaxID=3081768 RepID=A0ABZ0M4H8_9ACTN|nr:SSI family serine proteinase inhibitor [Streptomyces sp. HUAS YS2]WOX26390.1 SSI family serine proteinase inhibitor [Streptomyces sp. HUAS YS2]